MCSTHPRHRYSIPKTPQLSLMWWFIHGPKSVQRRRRRGSVCTQLYKGEACVHSCTHLATRPTPSPRTASANAVWWSNISLRAPGFLDTGNVVERFRFTLQRSTAHAMAVSQRSSVHSCIRFWKFGRAVLVTQMRFFWKCFFWLNVVAIWIGRYLIFSTTCWKLNLTLNLVPGRREVCTCPQKYGFYHEKSC